MEIAHYIVSFIFLIVISIIGIGLIVACGLAPLSEIIKWFVEKRDEKKREEWRKTYLRFLESEEVDMTTYDEVLRRIRKDCKLFLTIIEQTTPDELLDNAETIREEVCIITNDLNQMLDRKFNRIAKAERQKIETTKK